MIQSLDTRYNFHVLDLEKTKEFKAEDLRFSLGQSNDFDKALKEEVIPYHRPDSSKAKLCQVGLRFLKIQVDNLSFMKVHDKKKPDKVKLENTNDVSYTQ